MKKIEKIVKEKITEMFNPNDLAWRSDDYVKKLSSVRKVDNVNPQEKEDDEFDVIQELKTAVIDNDDEVIIEFDDGKGIKLDINIVKYMLANFTEQQIICGLESMESLQGMMEELFDVIYLDDEVEDEIEDIIGDE